MGKVGEVGGRRGREVGRERDAHVLWEVDVLVVLAVVVGLGGGKQALQRPQMGGACQTLCGMIGTALALALALMGESSWAGDWVDGAKEAHWRVERTTRLLPGTRMDVFAMSVGPMQFVFAASWATNGC